MGNFSHVIEKNQNYYDNIRVLYVQINDNSNRVNTHICALNCMFSICDESATSGIFGER